MNDTVVSIKGLVKSYGSQPVVNDINLAVRRGEIFGVLGANGAGKTTSVECAQGLRRPDAGTVRVLGVDPITDRDALRGRVGSQLQDSNLPDRMTVGGALALFADNRIQVQKATNDWDLSGIARTPFAALSGGQRQRLFLALALLNQPEIVFLDELTQGLDPSARREVWQLIEQVRDQGTTVVLVTHFMEEAEMLCDRVVVMVNGSIVDRGTPADLIERHSSGVRVCFPGSLADLEWIREVPMVAKATFDGTELEVQGPSPVIAYLGASMERRDRIPATMRVAQPNLEDALLTLISQRSMS